MAWANRILLLESLGKLVKCDNKGSIWSLRSVVIHKQYAGNGNEHQVDLAQCLSTEGRGICFYAHAGM